MTIELTYDKKSLKILNGSLEPLIEGDSKMPKKKNKKKVRMKRLSKPTIVGRL